MEIVITIKVKSKTGSSHDAKTAAKHMSRWIEDQRFQWDNYSNSWIIDHYDINIKTGEAIDRLDGE